MNRGYSLELEDIKEFLESTAVYRMWSEDWDYDIAPRPFFYTGIAIWGLTNIVTGLLIHLLPWPEIPQMLTWILIAMNICTIIVMLLPDRWLIYNDDYPLVQILSIPLLTMAVPFVVLAITIPQFIFLKFLDRKVRSQTKW